MSSTTLTPEQLYDEIHKEYLRVCVEPHVYNPNLRHPETILYKGHEFLHPNHTKRMMQATKRK